MSLFGFQVSSPTVRAVACDGMRPRSRRSPMRGRVCIPAGLYASVCIRGCIHLLFPFRLGSNVPGMVRGRVCIVCIIPL